MAHEPEPRTDPRDQSALPPDRALPDADLALVVGGTDGIGGTQPPPRPQL